MNSQAERDALSAKILTELKQEMEEFAANTVGWTKVEYPHGYKSRYDALDIELWVDENSIGKYKKYGRTFVFQNEYDAAYFLLKWS
jgi:hypothetical protein